MDLSGLEDENHSSGSQDDGKSPRKPWSLLSSSRKRWSLMDRNTDDDWNEMGVSLLDPDSVDENSSDLNTNNKPNLKRKHDIENVNPKQSKYADKCSPKKHKSQPSPGSSKVKSPRTVEILKPLQDNNQQLSETSFSEAYVVDEETPLAQSIMVQPQGTPSSSKGSSAKKRKQEHSDESPVAKRLSTPSKPPTGPDAFQVLSDEMILSIFTWLSKRALSHCMLVCKRWNRVASDETLWQRLDLGYKTITQCAMDRIVSRKPIAVRMAHSVVRDWIPTQPSITRIQYLDLSACLIKTNSLNSLLSLCPSLRKLSLESLQVNDYTCELLGRCDNMELLNLTMVQGLTAIGVNNIIQGCPNLLSLNVAWCTLSENALEVLSTSLPPGIRKLNMAGAKLITDEMVRNLCERCRHLIDLDLSDCSKISESSINSIILNLDKLEHLSLSRCYFLPPSGLEKLNMMQSLHYLDVFGFLHADYLVALKDTLAPIKINEFMFSAIARPTVAERRTAIWGIKCR